MAQGALALGMMGGGMDEGGNVDPRTQMMRAMLMQNMQGGQSGDGPDHGPNGESGGEVGTRHIDQGTTQPHIGSSDQSTMDEISKTVPGFDPQSGLPTEFPATERKNKAADILQKANEDPALQPWSGKKRILTALSAFVPIAGPAIIHSQLQPRRQAMENVNMARQQYDTEANLEQGQRDQALREKVAMANIETSRAMKTLMASVAARGQDKRLQGSEERGAVSGAEHGYDVTYDGQGGQHIAPKAPGDLSEVTRRTMEVQQATEELKRAQAAAVPEVVKIKQSALDLANQRLSAYLQNMDFSQQMSREKQDFHETGPTNAMRDRSQQANVIDETGKQLIQDITTGKDHIGPILGRYGSLTNFLGNPPPEYSRLASELTTYIALQPAAHGFKGMRAVQEFEKSIGTPIRTPEALIAAIQGNVKGLQPMEGAQEWTPLRRAEPRSILKKKPTSGGGAPPSGGGGNGARSVVRDAQGNLSFAPQ